jgi:hypothetical protein
VPEGDVDTPFQAAERRNCQHFEQRRAFPNEI